MIEPLVEMFTCELEMSKNAVTPKKKGHSFSSQYRTSNIQVIIGTGLKTLSFHNTSYTLVVSMFFSARGATEWG